MRGTGLPPLSPRTGEVQLVQAVISHSSIAGALADVGSGRGVRAKPPGTGSQPATHPEALEEVAKEGPEQAAGQVPVGRRQRPPQRPQRRPQVLSPLCEISLCPERERGVSGGTVRGQEGLGTSWPRGRTRSRSRSAWRRCLQKSTEGSEWGRVTGSPQTKSLTTAPRTSATFSAQKASVGHSHCVHPQGSSVWGWGQQHPASAALCPPRRLQARGLHPMDTKEPPHDRVHPNRFHHNGLCLTHTQGYPVWGPSPSAQPSSIHPMASAPLPPQLSPISDPPRDPPS